MIYVLKLPHCTDKNVNELCWCIKFGYSENWEDKRKRAYDSMFGFYKILHRYEEGTLEDESKIKEYFKDHTLRGNEWLKYDNEVLEFFETNNTIEKLREALKDIIISPSLNNLVSAVDMNLIKFLESQGIDTERNIYNSLKKVKLEDRISQVSYLYGLSEEEINNGLEERKRLIESFNPEVVRFSDEFNSCSNTVDKLKSLVNFGENNKDYLDQLFNLIPNKFKVYYLKLGPDRIKAKYYQELDLKRELAILCDNSQVEGDIKGEILKEFTIGRKVSKSEAKQFLKDLYSKLDYKKSAKATDLEEYFEVKQIKVQDSSGKWVNGIEILSKK